MLLGNQQHRRSNSDENISPILQRRLSHPMNGSNHNRFGETAVDSMDYESQNYNRNGSPSSSSGSNSNGAHNSDFQMDISSIKKTAIICFNQHVLAWMFSKLKNFDFWAVQRIFT